MGNASLKRHSDYSASNVLALPLSAGQPEMTMADGTGSVERNRGCCHRRNGSHNMSMTGFDTNQDDGSVSDQYYFCSGFLVDGELIRTIRNRAFS